MRIDWDTAYTLSISASLIVIFAVLPMLIFFEMGVIAGREEMLSQETGFICTKKEMEK